MGRKELALLGTPLGRALMAACHVALTKVLKTDNRLLTHLTCPAEVVLALTFAGADTFAELSADQDTKECK